MDRWVVFDLFAFCRVILNPGIRVSGYSKFLPLKTVNNSSEKNRRYIEHNWEKSTLEFGLARCSNITLNHEPSILRLCKGSTLHSGDNLIGLDCAFLAGNCLGFLTNWGLSRCCPHQQEVVRPVGRKIFQRRHNYCKRCSRIKFYNPICGSDNGQHCSVNQILDM